MLPPYSCHQNSKISFLFYSFFIFADEVVIEIRNSPCPPKGDGRKYTIERKFDDKPFEAMHHALQKFSKGNGFVSDLMNRVILGKGAKKKASTSYLLEDFSAPGLPQLNDSQNKAVEQALQDPISLIQGPPGTGKTVTSASIVYHLAHRQSGPVLVCAPSNVATDQLCQYIHQTGLKVSIPIEDEKEPIGVVEYFSFIC